MNSDERLGWDTNLEQFVNRQVNNLVSRKLAHRHMRRGIQLLQSGLIENATSHFFKAARSMAAAFDPCDAKDAAAIMENLTFLGVTHQRMNRHPEARRYFLQSAKLDPLRCSEMGGVAEYIVRHGTQEEITEYFEREYKHDPKRSLAPFFMKVSEVFPRSVAQLETKLAQVTGLAESKPNLIIPVPVWGAKHVEMLLKYAVPNWLATGNFPALSELYRIHVRIFCGHRDVSLIRDSAVMGKLATIAEIDFDPYEESLISWSDNHIARFQLFSYPHYVALEAARRQQADVVFAFPDNFVNNGFYGTLGKLLREDAGVVACQAFRLNAQDVLPSLDAKFRTADGTIAIPSREMDTMLIDHLADEWFADSDRMTQTPMIVCWRVGERGIIVRSSHFMPYGLQAKYISHALTPHIDPVDGLFLCRHYGALEKIILIEDAKMRVFGAEAIAVMGNNDGSERTLDEYWFARFLQEYITPLHRRYLAVPLRVGQEVDHADFQTVQDESDRFVNSVLRLLDRFEARAPKRPRWVPPMSQEMVDGH